MHNHLPTITVVISAFPGCVSLNDAKFDHSSSTSSTSFFTKCFSNLLKSIVILSKPR